MSDYHHSTAPAERPLDITSVGWEAFALAAMIRESLMRAGGDEPSGLHLQGDAQEAVVLGLDRLVELSRSIAKAGATR